MHDLFANPSAIFDKNSISPFHMGFKQDFRCTKNNNFINLSVKTIEKLKLPSVTLTFSVSTDISENGFCMLYIALPLPPYLGIFNSHKLRRLKLMEKFGEYDLSQLKRPIFGLYISVPDPALVEMAHNAGFRFIRIDMEHTLFSYERTAELIRTARLLGMEAQVRISSISDITKFLDQGVTGIICPDVDTVQTAQEVINRTKYAPLGNRGMFPVSRFAKFGLDPFDSYVRHANDTVLTGIQLESLTALDHMDEILALEGLDLVSSGKADLAQSMGLVGQMSHPDVIKAENLIIQKTLEYGKEPTVLVNNRQRVHELWDMGVRIMSVGPDISLIANLYKDTVDNLF